MGLVGWGFGVGRCCGSLVLVAGVLFACCLDVFGGFELVSSCWAVTWVGFCCLYLLWSAGFVWFGLLWVVAAWMLFVVVCLFVGYFGLFRLMVILWGSYLLGLDCFIVSVFDNLLGWLVRA